MAAVRWLSIAPVKGMALADVDEVELTREGVPQNRRFYLVDERGRFYAGIRDGRLVRIRAESDAEGTRLALTFPDGSVVDGEVELGETLESTPFYGSPRLGRVVHGAWSEAVSGFVGKPLALHRAERPGGGVDRARGPFSLVSQASLDALARQAGTEAFDRRRFRMLIGIDGVEAHGEDAWLGRRLRVGGAVVRPLELVARCAITTHSPDTGVPDFDTLRTIRAYRGVRPDDGKSIDFGIAGEVVEPAAIRVGDLVEPV